MSDPQDISLRQHHCHPRDWRTNLYVYPVISRRSGGLSIGINLNPDTACNFDCVYCQVDRTGTPRTRSVDPDLMANELTGLIDEAVSGSLFQDPAFADVPQHLREIKDIAFSGDGEPTTCKHFLECLELTASAKQEAGLDATKLVLITDACYLTRPEVKAGLDILDANNGRIWAKLDAGTDTYFQRVDRPNFPLQHVMDNIIDAARARPIEIQSLFMQLEGQPPEEAELLAYVDRLNEIVTAGGKIENVQVYTVARQPAESYVTALSNEEVDRITALVRKKTSLRATAYYGAS